MVHIDKVELIDVLERAGTLVRVLRGYTVTGLTRDNWSATDEAVGQVGVPRYGDRLDPTPGSAGYSMICHERQVKLLDKGTAQITITYENAFMVDNMEDSFDSPFMGSMGGSVRCNVNQKTSNLDGSNNQIILYHTYPLSDPNFPGETKAQGGEITYFAPQRSFSIHGIKVTSAPWAIANNITGRVNFRPFSGEYPRRWLCTAVDWKPESTIGGQQRYFMRFEFQYDEDTWDPTAVFIDPVEGIPPADLVFGAGIKVIQKLPAVDFEYIIGTWIQGG